MEKTKDHQYKEMTFIFKERERESNKIERERAMKTERGKKEQKDK